MPSIDLLITGAKQLLYFSPNGNGQWSFNAIADGCIAIADGRVVQIGTEAEVLPEAEIGFETRQVEATGKVITPGLVDSHTHPVFFQTRENEFEMRVQGKSYEEIAAVGGGIRSSVRGVREASKEELKDVVSRRLERFLSLGTTTIEAKSGYGLSLDAEVKSLEVIRELNEEQALEMVPTFLGAHEVPTEYRENRDEYINLVTEEMIPHVEGDDILPLEGVGCEKLREGGEASDVVE